MEFEEDDVRRLKLFTLLNGYYLRESCPESCNSQHGNKELVWCKAQFGQESTFEQVENLHQIKQFELDLSNGSNKEFINGVLEQGSDAEPFWGTGSVDDPGDTLLPPKMRLFCVEKTVHSVNESENDTFDMIMVIKNRYGLVTSSFGCVELIDLCRLNASEKTHDRDSNMCSHIKEMFPPTNLSFSLSFIQRLTSFMGMTVIAFGNSIGDVVFYEESYFMSKYPHVCEDNILHLKLDDCYTNITTCDGNDSSSNLTVLSNNDTVTVLYFDTSFENPIIKKYKFDDKLVYVNFLQSTEAGFFLIVRNEKDVKQILHFSSETLRQGKLLCEIVDSLSSNQGKCQKNSCLLVSKDDFLSVSDFEFLTLSFNVPRNQHLVHKIYQDSLILESLPLYPSESNNLGFGACIAQVEVPVPNFSLLYENDDLIIDNPIHLRYTTYERYGYHYEDIYANKKLLKSSQLDYDDCYVSRRAHGTGNSKVFKVEPSTRRCSENSAKYPESESLALLNLQLNVQHKRIEEIRHKMKGHSEFKIDSISFPHYQLDHLRDIHLHKIIMCASTDISSLQNLKYSNSYLKKELQTYIKDLSAYGEETDDDFDSYVNATIRKYLQIKDESRFLNSGPRYDSNMLDDNFLIEVDQELSIRMYGMNPMILNAFSPSILSSNLNCLDLRSNNSLVCHIKEMHCVAVATSSGLVFLFRLAEWRGVYAFRFEKLLNVIRIQDICEDSDDESRASFCETQRRFAKHDSSFVSSCNKCRLVIEFPNIRTLNYTFHHNSQSATLYVCTQTKLVTYTIETPS